MVLIPLRVLRATERASATKTRRWLDSLQTKGFENGKKLLKCLMPKDGHHTAIMTVIGFGKCQMITLPMISNGLASNPRRLIVFLYGKVMVGIGASQQSVRLTGLPLSAQ